MTGYKLFLLSTVATPAEVIARVLKNPRREDVEIGPPPITGVETAAGS
jgi:hypothetical protein